MKKEKRQNFVFWFSVTTTVVFSALLLALMAAEVYVRWKINQNFTFLGGFGLEALALLVVGQTLGLIYSQRS